MRDQNYTCYSIYLYIQNRKENPIKRILDMGASTNHVDQLGGGRGVVKYPLY